MASLMDEAIASLRRDVPPEHQDAIARVVMTLTGRNAVPHVLTTEERADLDDADAEIARGDFASDEDVRALWATYGL